MADVTAFNAAVRELAPFIAELGVVAAAVEADRVEAIAEWQPERCTAGGTARSIRSSFGR